MKKRTYIPLVVMVVFACRKSQPTLSAATTAFAPSVEFNAYWNAGVAELSRYDLTQARYGNLHRGEMLAIVVAEPFNAEKQVKADRAPGAADTVVLKAQLMRRFATGIYDYAMTTTSFKPLNTSVHPQALKVTGSSVDWCGHTWLQLNWKKDGYAAQGRSYFEESGDEDFVLPGALSEDEIWQRIRMAPQNLPVGKVQMIPSMFSSRLRHRRLTAAQAMAELQTFGALKHTEYSVSYDVGLPAERKITFVFESGFPHKILEFQEIYMDGFKNPKKLTTVARLKKTVRSAYWQEHNPEHAKLRREFGVVGAN